MSGKGSKPRPYSVDQDTFDSNWDRIFNKQNKQEQALQEMIRISEELGDYIDTPLDNPLIKK